MFRNWRLIRKRVFDRNRSLFLDSVNFEVNKTSSPRSRLQFSTIWCTKKLFCKIKHTLYSTHYMTAKFTSSGEHSEHDTKVAPLQTMPAKILNYRFLVISCNDLLLLFDVFLFIGLGHFYLALFATSVSRLSWHWKNISLPHS